MNFNISRKADYDLQGRHTNEVINLYGIRVKLLLTEKINYDENVFGDFQSIKTDKEKVFDLYMLPENSNEYDDINVNYSEFGMLSVENIRLFVSRKSISNIFESQDGVETDVDPNSPVKKLISNLIILPNNRVMEITNVEFMVPGINNLFTEKDIKHVYKLTLKTYDRKLSDDISAINTDEMVGSYKELESYFDELTSKNVAVDEEAKITPDETTKIKVLEKPIDPVFGRF